AMKASLAESGEGMPFAALADGPLRNFFFPAQQTTLIPSLQWDGADLSGLFDYLEQGETPPLEATGLISVGRAEATDMQTLVNGKRASFTEYSVLEPVEFEWLVPTKIRATSRGMLTDMTAYVPADEPELLAIVKDHGLDKLSSEGSLSWAYDAGEGAADLTYDITMQDFGDVDMNFGLSGAPLPQLYQAVTTENPMMLMGMAVDGLSIRIRDREMVDTAVEIAALQTGQDAGELRDSLPAMLELGSAQAAAVIPEINDYVAALSAFVSDGGTLEIAMTPDEPVPLMTLMLLSQTSPQMIPSTLALRVTHDE
ncbi:hypothetical protein, partial [uncultured Nitratireductor sp.]|uniref:hypothetical protein n=1 Tax=uncultured Nitratireductor sp. TaxID=520953 RepID=UPI0025D9711D